MFNFSELLPKLREFDEKSSLGYDPDRKIEKKSFFNTDSEQSYDPDREVEKKESAVEDDDCKEDYCSSPEKFEERQEYITNGMYNIAEKKGLTTDKTAPVADGVSNPKEYIESPIRVSIVNKEVNEGNDPNSRPGGYSICKGWKKENLNSPTQKNTESIAAILQGKIETPTVDSVTAQRNDMKDYAIGRSNYINLSKMPGGTHINEREWKQNCKNFEPVVRCQMETADSDIIYCGGKSPDVFEQLANCLKLKGKPCIELNGYKNFKAYIIDKKLYIDGHHPSFQGWSENAKSECFKELADVRNRYMKWKEEHV